MHTCHRFHRRCSLALLFVYGVTRIIVFPVPVAHALISNGANAIDQLGQYDDSLSAPAPSYTKAAVNDGPNKLGFDDPGGLVFDPVDHRVFVVETTNNRVLVYTLNADNTLPDRIPDYVIGQTDFYTNTAANTQAGLNVPHDAAYDSANDRLFVAETTGDRVKVFDLSGGITNGMNAAFVLGQTTFTGAGNATTQAGMNGPRGVAYDPLNQYLFVSQITANRVTVYNLADGIVNGENAIKVLGQANFTTATAATTQAGMNVPYGLAYDAVTKYLFVSQDTGNRVTVFDLSDGITDGESAINVLGQADFVTAAAANTQAGLNDPRNIAYDGIHKHLYVAQLTGNRVTVFDLSDGITNGESAINVLGQALFTTVTAADTQAGFRSPYGVAYASGSNLLYVSQTGNHRVSIFDVSSITNGENAADGLGQYDDSLSAPSPVYTKASANNGPNKLGLNAPQDVALDRVNHRLFAADAVNNRVFVYNLTAANRLIDRIPDAVLGQPNFYSNAAASTQAGMSAPQAVDYDPAGNRLFVSLSGQHRVLVFDVASITDGENAVGVIGQTNFTTVTAGNTQAKLNTPQGLEFDPGNKYLYVAQSGNHRVSVFDLSDGVTDGENAVDLLGQYDESLSAPAPVYTKVAANDGVNRLGYESPEGVFVDTVDHRVFVVDTTHNRVLVYTLNADNTLPDRIPDYVIGQANFYTETAASTQAGLNAPEDVEYDSANDRLFVLETTGDRVKVFDLSGGITNGMNAAFVLGQTTFAGAGNATTQAGMNGPRGMAYDPANQYLFVAQSTANRVTVYNLADGITNGENAIKVLGQANFTTATAATTQAGMNVPRGVAYDRVNKYLFVSQSTGNRVTVYNLADGITDGENAIKVLGQANFTTATAATTQAGMNDPRHIDYDEAGRRLFVAQDTGNRVTVYDLSDGITDGENAASVLGQALFTTATAGNTQAGMNSAFGISFASGGNLLYVSQISNHRISVFDTASITNGENAVNGLGQYDGNLSDPAPVYTKILMDNGPNRLGFNAPQDVALDSVNHRLFVSDTTNNRVVGYDLDSNNRLIDRIPDDVLGQTDFYSNATASTQAGMSAPQYFALDPLAHRLFVSLSGQNRVLVFHVAAITDGESAVNVIGQTNFTTVTAGTTQAKLSAPQGILYDRDNEYLYIAQSGNSRIGVFDAGMKRITGTAYADEGLTPLSSGKKVAVSLHGGSVTATGVTIAGGQFTISGTGAGLTMTGGTILSVYLDNNAEKGVTVTLGSGSAMSGVHLYQNRLIVRNDSGSVALTNNHLSVADNNGDADITSIFTVDSSTLNVKSGKSLLVWAGDTFTPGGGISVGSGITINGTLNGGANTIALSGAWLLRPSGAFSAATSTVVLDGANQTLSGSTTFYDLQKVVASAASLTFAATTTQTILGTLRFEGASLQSLSLLSSRPGTRWNIDPQGPRDISDVTVTDSENVHATAIECLSGCTNGGNNINWIFGSSVDDDEDYFFFIGG
jgi:DNA-binding beta-propeller fold protein YncE